ncbi:hypothetical protein [Asticcacaulis solisilvae]|uniref:hypothetical protein n=1 Tax=Asticcacaulis solisilvae TaxID=1217274 RepID=UPI003FD85854
MSLYTKATIAVFAMAAMGLGGCQKPKPQALSDQYAQEIAIPVQAIAAPEGESFEDWAQNTAAEVFPRSGYTLCVTQDYVYLMYATPKGAEAIGHALGADGRYSVRMVSRSDFVAQCQKARETYAGDVRTIEIAPDVKLDDNFFEKYLLRHFHLSLSETYGTSRDGNTTILINYPWAYKEKDRDFASVLAAMKAQYGANCCKVLSRPK